MKNKKIITLACTAMLLAAIIIPSTLAYFHDRETVTNEFTGAGNPGSGEDSGLKIKLEEPGWDPDKGVDILPGDVIYKDPTVTNEKDDAYVRMIVELVDQDGTPITDPARAEKIMTMLYYAETAVTAKMDSAELATYLRVNSQFTQDATRSKVGVYYYNYSANDGIMAHKEVKTLFSGVIVPTDWDQDDVLAMGNFDIVVTAEAIQAKNFLNANEAFAALDSEMAN